MDTTVQRQDAAFPGDDERIANAGCGRGFPHLPESDRIAG
jgi:hypothetical protein